MVYLDTRGMSPEQKVKMKRQLTMQKMALEADLKKWERKQLETTDALNRFKKDRDRATVYIEEQKSEAKKIVEKEVFINEEIKRVKKKLIELG